MARLDWEKARKRDTVRDRGAVRVEPEPRRKKQRGISNEQAKELARLQRALKQRYSGNGMTYEQAESAIDAARSRLRAKALRPGRADRGKR